MTLAQVAALAQEYNRVHGEQVEQRQGASADDLMQWLGAGRTLTPVDLDDDA